MNLTIKMPLLPVCVPSMDVEYIHTEKSLGKKEPIDT